MSDTTKKPDGRAKGGAARRDKLTPERRSEIARNAALKRHSPIPIVESNSSNGLDLPMATHQGQMAVGELLLDCYVLADGRRVFHKRGMAKALGLKSEGGNAFIKTMQGKGLGSVLPEKLREKINNPINFKPLIRDLGHGYEADILVDVAKAIVSAANNGAVTRAQEPLVAQAKILVNAFAKIGVVALIDAIHCSRKTRVGETISRFFLR
jgi:hypothetical protein